MRRRGSRIPFSAAISNAMHVKGLLYNDPSNIQCSPPIIFFFPVGKKKRKDSHTNEKVCFISFPKLSFKVCFTSFPRVSFPFYSPGMEKTFISWWKSSCLREFAWYCFYLCWILLGMALSFLVCGRCEEASSNLIGISIFVVQMQTDPPQAGLEGPELISFWVCASICMFLDWRNN